MAQFDNSKPWWITLLLRQMSLFCEALFGVVENICILVWVIISICIIVKINVSTDPFFVVRTIGADWKYMLLLFFPFMYRPVKKFVDEIKEFGGMKRQTSNTPATESASNDKQYTEEG